MTEGRASRSSFAQEEYRRIRALWRGETYTRRRQKLIRGEGASMPFERGRDPRVIGDVLDGLTKQFGWSEALGQVTVIEEWPNIVGEIVAGHAQVAAVRGDILIVQCDSTAWTTELRRLRGEIVTKITEQFPEAGISDIKILAPGAPSWRHGSLHVPGRGPRDTYG